MQITEIKRAFNISGTLYCVWVNCRKNIENQGPPRAPASRRANRYPAGNVVVLHNEYKLMEWPSYSSDFNLIEMI